MESECMQYDLFCIKVLERIQQKIKFKKDVSQAEASSGDSGFSQKTQARGG